MVFLMRDGAILGIGKFHCSLNSQWLHLSVVKDQAELLVVFVEFRRRTKGMLCAVRICKGVFVVYVFV